MPPSARTVHPEIAKGPVELQLVPPQVYRDFSVPEVDGVLVDPTAVKYEWQDRQRPLGCIGTPTRLIGPYVARVIDSTMGRLRGEYEDVSARYDTGMIFV